MTIFVEKFDSKNLTVFTGTFNDLDFPVKPLQFSCKSQQIFLKNS